MPIENRVTPLGEVIAHPAHGLVYGNRGCLHDETGRICRHHNGRRWISCRLLFRGRRRSPLVQPGRYTSLFFLDEATAFAAGHRPCAECRRGDYVRFGQLWRRRYPEDRGADRIDARLHAERWNARGQQHHRAALSQLPDGALVLREGQAWLVFGAGLLRWTPAGYRDRTPRRTQGQAVVITPPSLIEVLRAGWQPEVPLLHPSAVTGG